MIPFLDKGDKIGLTATARKVNAEEMAPAVSILEGWGLEVVLADTLYESHDQFAGTDEFRARSLQDLIDDPSIKAVLCARGGYGTVRIVDQLNFTQFHKNPKWIVGFSDITVLHSHIQQQFHLPTIHAPMAINMQVQHADIESIECLRKMLFGDKLTYKVEPHEFNRNGVTDGVLVGGNLSVLMSINGSHSDIDTTDRILFIEDLDEYLYHIDRMMMCLKRGGKLEGLKGMIIGGMGDMKDNPISFGKDAYQIIHEHLKEFDFPVCFGFPAGHNKKNLPLMLGSEVLLNVNDGGVEVRFL